MATTRGSLYRVTTSGTDGVPVVFEMSRTALVRANGQNLHLVARRLDVALKHMVVGASVTITDADGRFTVTRLR